MPEETGDRRKLILAVLLVAVGAASAAIALAVSGGGGHERLFVQRAQSPLTGRPELLVSVEERVNVPGTADGRGSVVLECLGADGQVVLRQRQRWPFVDDGSTPLPHAHQPAAPHQIDTTERCRLRGTSVKLEGALSG